MRWILAVVLALPNVWAFVRFAGLNCRDVSKMSLDGGMPVSGSPRRNPNRKTSWKTTQFSEESGTSQRQSANEQAFEDENVIDEYEELGEQPGPFRSGFVSIIGNPNVGKSTLMNAMLGQDLSIVSPKPQTTRHRILGVVTNSTYQLVFSDTPGMLEPAYKLQEAMMDSVHTAAGDADIVCLVSDVYGEELADPKVMQKLLATGRPVVIVVNKADLVISQEGQISWGAVTDNNNTTPDRGAGRRRLLLRKEPKKLVTDLVTLDPDARPKPLSITQLVSLWTRRLPRASVVLVSAQLGWGVEKLLALLVSLAPNGPKYFPSETLTNRDERFFTSEIIRQSLLLCYQDEVPYSCEVIVDSFRNKKNDETMVLTVVEATVVTSRTSQKAILIGRGGSKLKELGSVARESLERFLGRRVFLSLRVHVDEDWRANPDALQRYGYVGEDFG